MKRLEILAAFEVEIDKINDAVEKPVTDDSLYWLNQAVAMFIKERFNGNAPHYTSYEQTEKRTRDLHNLFEESVLELQAYDQQATYDSYEYVYPEDLMYVLNEDVQITDMSGNNAFDTSIFECTADSFMYRITNSLTDFHYRHHKARPLRIRVGLAGDNYVVRLLTDKKYTISRYHISYLRKPELLTDENPDDRDVEYNDFTNDVWFEIIKIAAKMYIENQADNRYRTISAEVLTQE